jgi:hypothetical protein
MMKSRLFQVVFALAVVVFLVCGQQAQAQHHIQVHVVPGAHQGLIKSGAGYDELFMLSLGMGALPPVDGGGNDAWPCFPNPANANYPDCSTIAPGGVVIGAPAYTWSFANCDANAAGAPNCGQIFWFYEDDTGDNTDHLIVSIVVKQGLNYILDTGNYDFGPNPFPSGSVVVISDDVAFGTMGQTGKNNGFCAGSKKVCEDPVAGIATVSITTKVGASKITGKFNINLQ